MKKKLYVLTVGSSCEYGAECRCVGVYTTKKDAVRALKREYREARGDMDCEELDTSISDMSFEVSDYENHSDSVCGRIEIKTITI